MCYWDTACVMGLIIGNNYQNVLITGRYWTIITSSGREYPLNNMEFSNQFSSNRINYEANHRCYQWLYCHGDGLIVIFVVALLSLQVSNTIQMKIFQSASIFINYYEERKHLVKVKPSKADTRKRSGNRYCLCFQIFLSFKAIVALFNY